ncbi:MAG: helix-turn-helix domain-containing protein [Muribaculum sp.]|nr:helix-turn-helix domain-containing protein [Muribaculum sp.]
MQANNDLHSFDSLLDLTVGEIGTPKRDDLEQRAQSFCIGQMVLDARKQEKMTQAELARRVGTNKSYISNIEHGNIEPSASLFLRIISALGLRFEILKPSFTF